MKKLPPWQISWKVLPQYYNISAPPVLHPFSSMPLRTNHSPRISSASPADRSPSDSDPYSPDLPRDNRSVSCNQSPNVPKTTITSPSDHNIPDPSSSSRPVTWTYETPPDWKDTHPEREIIQRLPGNTRHVNNGLQIPIPFHDQLHVFNIPIDHPFPFTTFHLMMNRLSRHPPKGTFKNGCKHLDLVLVRG